ncbi:bifunctional diguanylate cyclase/phosphodiesterase [Asaia siamensis]|nr:bifunctional diguanylate cyclase/phosphodiesterase [Asaia siamensis]
MRGVTGQTRPDRAGHVLDWLPLLVCHVEADGRISYLNRSWERFSGIDPKCGAVVWTDLLENPGQVSCLPEHCQAPTSCSVHSSVALRHPGGAPVRTDLHWQKMGGTEGGGWILFCHPETDFPLLLPSLPQGETPEAPSAKAISGVQIDTGLDTLPTRPELFQPRVSSSLGSEPVNAKHSVRRKKNVSSVLAAQSASYTARRAFRTLSREMAARVDAREGKDGLTGLLDRQAFDTRLEQSMALAVTEGRALGFLIVDIDYLGDLNDLYGRDVGDQVLKLVADRLSLVTAHEGDAARTGDDEFSALLTGEVSASTLAGHAQALLSFIDLPLRLGNRQVRFGLSIGAALYPQDGEGVSQLRQAALLALNDVKAHGRGGFRLYHAGMAQRGNGVTAQTNSVRQMLDQDQIYPAYQAKVRLSDGHITGAEALMRWHGRSDLPSGPDAFPEIFRNYDLASRVSARVQECVFEDIALWRSAGLMPPPISINVAPVEFMQDDYAEKLLARLDSHGLSARLIELELTEHVLYQNSEHYIHRALALLRRAGVRITLDDFGTGYSSLGFLRDFPVSSIKIDRSFIRKICSESSMEVIVEAIIRFGEAVSVDVVAEGIETEAQLALLRRIGCPTGQGFLFSSPVASTGFARLLAGSRRFDL